MASSMFIAMFPLQLVIFPGEVIPLHIFEPRYKQLIGECESDGITFVITAYVNQSVSQYGTEVSLVKVMRRYEDGELDILVRGERVVRILEVVGELEDKLYPGARTEPAPYNAEVEDSVQERLSEKVMELAQLLERTGPITEPTQESFAFGLAPFLNMSLSQKLTLLAMQSERDRQEYLIRHVDTLIEAVRKRVTSQKSLMGQNGRANGVSKPSA